MTEKYLHFLWRSKRLLKPNLTLTDGRSVRIIHFGFYNRNGEGPDFSAAIVRIDDVEYFGPIELHIKSSDWYLHKHQNDPNYLPVILHVVLEHDREVIINGKYIPTLELQSQVDALHLAFYKKGFFDGPTIFCANSILTTNTELDEMKEIAIQKRLAVQRSLYVQNKSNPMVLVVKAFGFHINSDVMKQLWFQISEPRALDQDNSLEFHSKGSRPANKMSIRLSQINAFLELSSNDGMRTIENFKELVSHVNKKLKSNSVPPISKQLSNNILINAILPFYFFDGKIGLDQFFMELKKISAEKNSIITTWIGTGTMVNNAFDSQGLLWHYKFNCSDKKCLTCSVGKKLLSDDTKNRVFF
jgi:hypothetical protein